MACHAQFSANKNLLDCAYPYDMNRVARITDLWYSSYKENKQKWNSLFTTNL